MKQTKVLFIDIENTPLISYTWGRYEQNVVDVKQESFLLSFAYKWLGEKKVHVIALDSFRGFKQNKDNSNDKPLLTQIHKIMEKADVLIGHNLDAFDVKKINARFIYYGMSPIRLPTIDTVKIARRYFHFSSNKLDDLGRYLKVGQKIKTGGFNLWLQCMNGNKEAFRKMKAYNCQDVALLEKVYMKLRSWKNNHPLIGMPKQGPSYTTKDECPTCRGKLIVYGSTLTATRRYQRLKCLGCGRTLQGKVYNEFGGESHATPERFKKQTKKCS